MTPLPPEKRLMLAVLADAVATLRRTRTGRQRVVGEVRAWFAATDSGWPFSFVNVCDALGLEPARVRLLVATPPRPPGPREETIAWDRSTFRREEAVR